MQDRLATAIKETTGMKDKLITTREELVATLNDVSMTNTSLDFKWKFDIEEGHFLGKKAWHIRVGFERPDTETGKIGIGYGRYEIVSSGTTESGVVKTAWLLIELVVRHELMEAFRWRGKRIFNPHNSIYDLADVQGK